MKPSLKKNAITDGFHDLAFSVGWKKPPIPTMPYKHYGGAVDVNDGDDMDMNQLLTAVDPSKQQPTVKRPSIRSFFGFNRLPPPPWNSVYVLGVQRRYRHCEDEDVASVYLQANAVYIENGMFLSVADTFGRHKDPENWKHRIFAVERSLTVDTKRLAQGRLIGAYELEVISYSAELEKSSDENRAYLNSGTVPWKDALCLLRIVETSSFPSNRSAATPAITPSSDQGIPVNLMVYNAGPACGKTTLERYGSSEEDGSTIDITPSSSLTEHINRCITLLKPLRRSTSTGIAYEGDCKTAHNPCIQQNGPFLIYDMSTLPGASGGAVFLKNTGELLGLHCGSSATLEMVTKKDRNLAIRLSHDDLKVWFSDEVLTRLESDKRLCEAWSAFLKNR